MATISTFRAGGTSGVASYDVHWEIDIAKVLAANPTLTTNDKIDFFAVPANTRVNIHQIEIVTQGTLATRADVGDSSADTTWVNNASTLTTGTDLTLATTSKLYGSADAIFLKIGNAATTGVVRIAATLIDTTRLAKAVYPTAAIT